MYVHIIFNRPVSDKKVSHLLRNDTNLKENLCSLKQIHFTVHPYDEGLFSLKLQNDLPTPGTEGVKDLEDHLVGVLSSIRKLRAVQLIFNSDSGEMNELVDKVSPKIQAMLDSNIFIRDYTLIFYDFVALKLLENILKYTIILDFKSFEII